ncbi:MAG: 50S ribosomal protein L25 [Phycisphaerales bacterium]
MQAKHVLSVERRSKVGSRYAQRYREQGFLPTVLYGQGRPPVALNLNAKEAIKFFHLGEKVFTIELKEENVTQTVLLKDLQYDWLGTNIVHVDLERVDLTQVKESNVPIRLVGEAPGAKAAGAILSHPESTITVRCAVQDIPDHFDIDISAMQVGDSILVKDLPPVQGMDIVTSPETVLVTISIAKEAPAAEPTAGEGVEGEKPSA